MQPTCKAMRKDRNPCGGPALVSGYCVAHDPAMRDRIAAARAEAEVRAHVAAINHRINYVNSHITSGPPSNVIPLDVDRVVDRWRARAR